MSCRVGFVWGTPQVKTFLNGGTKAAPNFLLGISSKSFEMPLLHKAVIKTPPVVAKASAELRPGAWLVSLEFEATQWQPQARLQAPDGRALWLYQMPVQPTP